MDEGWRYAKVLTTVAYILTNDEDGNDVVEKWYIKHHKLYPQPEDNTSSLYGRGYAETVPLWVKNGWRLLYMCYYMYS